MCPDQGRQDAGTKPPVCLSAPPPASAVCFSPPVMLQSHSLHSLSLSKGRGIGNVFLPQPDLAPEVDKSVFSAEAI